ncbi:uncharacterized protein I206_106169 [Kwoniella pini CBS 10737]|uniref:Leucine-rich repeat-containing N-terminal plant-type domain-containing protein n=1 Tax=Kwoniella pini CBS 10737 TaxID=1296096 RepID=A0A1B9I1A4_9TREE|nr:uncharacterized protein I206_04994 [Kwoniella pini CBS 10737]OCF49304.1 hypothetical protein I206_04994 [Kwoniella pini CBS 10737]
MAPDTPRSSLFKSRFSILSLLPARHPPLHVTHPMPHRHEVPCHPTVVSSSISPVHSEYPDPSTPLPPTKQSNEKSRQGPKRPPPLNLDKTRMMYPSNHSDVVIEPDTSKIELPASIRPEAPPSSKKERKNLKAGRKVYEEDPFEVAEVEIGHRYPSWKGGQVDIKPGQVIPRDLVVPSLVSYGSNPRSSSPINSRSRTEEEEEPYESVLHNVLLTPTYFDTSPNPSSIGECSRYTRRKTLLGKATDTIVGVAKGTRNSEWLPGKSILKPSYALEADQSLRAMKAREEQEMERFRKNVRPVRLNVPDYEDDHSQRYGKSRSNVEQTSTWSMSSSSSPVREGGGAHKRSPGWIGAREYAAGGYEGQKARLPTNNEGGWRSTRAEEDKLKRKQRIWKVSIALAILVLAALIIGLCTTLLRKDSKTSSASSDPSKTTDGSRSTATSSAETPTSTSSETLQSCLDQFRVSPEPSTYPCGDCVPILSSVTNDYSQPVVNGNATGVGSTLQFCALKDVYQQVSGTKNGLNGWMIDSSPCGGWNGVSCDSRGRITGLLLQYPNVPDTLPESLGNIYALEAIHVLGNGSVPTGKFPSNLLSSPNLKTIDIEYSALSGSIDQAPFSNANTLNTLVLVNNPNLGNTLPDLSGNTDLLTVVVTGQGLVEPKADKLPSSLTYLDLSYNSLSGQIPSFDQLTNLNTLTLQNNKFTTSPNSLPNSIVSLSLTSNNDLSGSLPNSICSSDQLQNCDCRSTKLSGTISNTSNSSSNLSITTSSSSSSSSRSINSNPSTTQQQSSTTPSQPNTVISSSSSAQTSTSSPSTISISGQVNSMNQIQKREPASCGICKFT